jgi:hypothetical protein
MIGSFESRFSNLGDFLGFQRVGHASLVTRIANHLPTRLADYVLDD